MVFLKNHCSNCWDSVHSAGDVMMSREAVLQGAGAGSWHITKILEMLHWQCNSRLCAKIIFIKLTSLKCNIIARYLSRNINVGASVLDLENCLPLLCLNYDVLDANHTKILLQLNSFVLVIFLVFCSVFLKMNIF